MTVDMKRLHVVVPVAMLFSCTLALFGPVQLFLTNSLEFDFSFLQMLPFLAVITFCLFFAVALILVLLPGRFRIHERGVSVVFVLGLLLWFQGNCLVWKYGLLSGHEIEWGGRLVYGLIDTPLWIAGLLLAACGPAILYKWARKISPLILLMQLLFASFLVIRQPEVPSFKKFQISATKKFEFSSRRNIIVLVLDSFQSDVFQEIIDRDPSYKEYFSDFTYFRNNMGGFPSTYAAIPFLLTAQSYDNSKPIQSFMAEAYLSPSSIPRELLAQGWQVDLFPAVRKSIYFDPAVFSNFRAKNRSVGQNHLAHLFDVTLFRYLPHFLKRAVYNNENWFLTRWLQKDEKADAEADDDPDDGAPLPSVRGRRMRRSSPRLRDQLRVGFPSSKKLARVNPDVRFVSVFLKTATAASKRHVFKFYHLRGPHEPIRMNADLQPVNAKLTRDNLVDLARGEIKLVHFFLEGLRDLGVYDNALIFILGDHGHPWGAYGLRLPPAMAGLGSRTGAIPKGVIESGIPLLLVKRPGNRAKLEISDAPTSLVDVSATVFHELGLGRIGAGEPLFQIPADRPRERRFLYYNWNHNAWLDRYLPDLVEYRVNGNSWLSSSWRPTGKVFKPGG